MSREAEGGAASTLRWSHGAELDEATRERLLGPGAPFETAIQDVLGVRQEVFVRRPRSLPAVLESTARAHPDRVYLAFPERELTYASVRDAVRRLAGVLASRYGISKGDRVAMVGANALGYALAYWATLELGAIVAGLNGWWSASELRYGIELSAPKVVLGDRPRLDRLREAAPPGDRPEVPVATFDELLDALEAGGLEPPGVEIDEDDPAIILFTSGTTGRPKGATLSHRNLVHFGHMSLMRIAIGAALAPAGAGPSADLQPSSLCVSPFFHVSGTVALLGQPWSGAKVVFPEPGRWSEEVHLQLTERHRLTSWSGVPTQFWRLLQYPDLDRFDLSSLRSVGGGGATFQPELIRQLSERFPGISIGVGYGMSESTGMGLGTGGPLLAAYPTSLGVPNPTSEVEIRRPDGTKAPDGEVGEICLRHASIFLGYWDDEAASKEALDADRWYRTGDYGRIVDGLVYLESRLRDLIIRGGENIYPIEIENRLVEHPDIDDAAVIGVDHPTLGQEVLAVVVVRGGESLSSREVREWVRSGLASFKVPAHVAFVTDLPYTESGKLQKRLLEERADELLAGSEPEAAEGAN